MSHCNCKNQGAGHYCRAGNRELYQATLFPSPSPALGTQGYISPDHRTLQPSPLIMRNAKSDCKDGRSCSWWWITIHPKAVRRVDLDTDTLYDPLTERDIIQADEQSSTINTTIKVRITLSDNTALQRVIYLDVGAGVSFGWYGSSVKIDVLVSPPQEPLFGTYTIRKTTGQGSQPPILARGVEDVLVEANAVVLDYPPGLSGVSPVPLTFTQTFNLFQLEVLIQDLVYPRPPGARRVAYYVNPFSTVQGLQFGILSSPLPTAVQPGEIIVGDAWNAVGPIVHPDAGSPIDVPGMASALVVKAAGSGAWTVVWEVIP
jgi:hypothetical protein